MPPPLSNAVTPRQIRLFTFLLGGGLAAAELTLEVAQGEVGEREGREHEGCGPGWQGRFERREGIAVEGSEVLINHVSC